MRSRSLTLGTAALLAAALASFGAAAKTGNGADTGDSYLNDLQRNPRLIEPYAEQTRYRAYDPRAGWYDRQNAAGYRGQIRVRPYYGYD